MKNNKIYIIGCTDWSEMFLNCTLVSAIKTFLAMRQESIECLGENNGVGNCIKKLKFNKIIPHESGEEISSKKLRKALLAVELFLKKQR